MIEYKSQKQKDENIKIKLEILESMIRMRNKDGQVDEMLIDAIEFALEKVKEAQEGKVVVEFKAA